MPTSLGSIFAGAASSGWGQARAEARARVEAKTAAKLNFILDDCLVVCVGGSVYVE